MIRLAVLLLVLAWPALAEAADPFDFVVQQVCVDARDHAVPGDPAHCAQARRLRIGEAVPTRRVDAGNWQAFTAYPVQGVDGRPLAMVAKVFGGNDTSGSYGDLGARSGYDLLAVDGGFVSGIRTSDQGAGDQIFWRSADCARTNGWIFFPVGLQPGERGERRSTLKITKGPSVDCPLSVRFGSIAPDDTVWERPTEPVRYTSGKLLDSIISMHFAYGDPADPAYDDDSMEKFYFTRPYGYTRWEAWQTPQGCARRVRRSGGDPLAQCQPYPEARCSGPNTATYFGKLYLRLDCRDVTFTVADTDRPFDPLVSAAAPGDVLTRNLLDNGTFFDGPRGWEASPGAVPEREPRSNNAVLVLPAGGTLAQTFGAPSGGVEAAHLRVGLTLAPAAGPVTLHLTLRLDGISGDPVTVSKTVLAPAGPATTLHWDCAGPARLRSGRLDAAIEGGAARLDDLYVTPVPAESVSP